MKIVYLDAKTLGYDLDLSAVSELGEAVIYPNTPQDDVKNVITDADVIIVNKLKLNESNLQYAKNLKLICVTATGYDNIDIDYCRNHNIAVCNVVGYSSHSVAQLTVAMALNLYMKLQDYTDFVNDGSYTKSGVANKLAPTYHELHGKVWGIVGLGAIGRQVAAVAQALGCKVIAFKRTPDNSIPCCNLSYLFRKADIISVHLPLSDETKGIIDKDMISSMKEDAILINVARGAVIDEEALTEAVLDNKIGGIGIDVYSKEPFSEDHPYYKLLGNKKAYLTPHMAWGAYEARIRCLDEVLENIRAFFRGEIRNRLDV
ncbi:MAG: hydroxyacid dehydrogenase [Clostridia bacterium]|nr:hydroxyacid dehydrogenase [Clostridia bacterium]